MTIYWQALSNFLDIISFNFFVQYFLLSLLFLIKNGSQIKLIQHLILLGYTLLAARENILLQLPLNDNRPALTVCLPAFYSLLNIPYPLTDIILDTTLLL